MELGGQHLGDQVGDIGFDIQLDVVVAKAVGINLLQHAGVVHDSLVVGGDVKVHLNREGDAQSGQFLDGLLLILFGFVRIQAGNGLTVDFRQSQLLADQLGVVGTVRGVGETGHAVELIFAAERIDRVGAFPVLGQVKSVVPGKAEGLVCDGGVPVDIRCPILQMFVIVKVNLVGAGGGIFNQIVVVWIFRIVVDSFQVALGEGDGVDFARLIELVHGVVGFHHLDCDGVEKLTVLIPVERVFSEDFLVALYVGGHGVAAIVPHVFVVHGFYTGRAAQFIDHRLRHRPQAGGEAVPVRARADAAVDQGVRIRGFNADHLFKDGALLCGQRKGFLLGEGLGILIIFVCTLQHNEKIGGLRGLVLVEV